LGKKIKKIINSRFLCNKKLGGTQRMKSVSLSSGLKEKLLNKSAILGVVGLGYVGLPLSVEKAKAGFKTIGFDVQETKVRMVNSGINYIGDVINEDLEQIVKSGKLSATTNFAEVAKADCVCICVPTPLDKHQQPDISYVKSSAESIVPYMHRDMLIVLESTTYPGTTEELLKPILEKSGLKCGVDFYLAFSPERVDPGNLKYKTKNTPKVVGGVTAACTEVAAALYESILEAPIHKVSSPAVAEMEKILENTYRNVNIGLVNELAILSNKMGINFWEVIDAAKSKPYGFQAFYPGPGLGGHCIPLDPYYLSWKAREYGFHTSMIEASMMVNDRMPEYTVERASKILNRFKKAMNGSRILVLGVAYKQDIEDFRESPALRVIEELEKEGAEVVYYDPYVPEYNDHGNFKKGESELTAELIESADLVIVTTAHSNVDYSFVQKCAKTIFDTKNALKDIKSRKNIELL
jgi:UDP-N-acetyl-D-glucosamine dehydrogenase